MFGFNLTDVMFAFSYGALAIAATTIRSTTSPMPLLRNDFEAIDAYVMQQLTRRGIPGMGLGIVLDDAIAHVRGFGSAGSTGRHVTPQTRFHIGSITQKHVGLRN